MAGLHLPAGFQQWTGNVPFLVKDLVLFAASVYLLRQDVARVAFGERRMRAARAHVVVDLVKA
jgi:hypothetical protein